MWLKALLIDDEKPILNHLHTGFPWEEWRIEVIGLARNGNEALALVERHHPDLVLCDIRMPVIDGLEFLQQIREQGETAEVIMITGYEDFDYARTALKYQAAEYLLKPIDYEELARCVQRLAGRIREERSAEQDARRRWDRLTAAAYEKLLFDALLGHGSVPSSLVLPEGAELLENQSLWLLLVDIDSYSQREHAGAEQQRKLANFTVNNIVSEAWEDRPCAVLQLREGEFSLVHQDEGGLTVEALAERAQSLRDAVLHYAKVSVHIALYPEPVSSDFLASAYRKLQSFLHLSASGKGVAVYERPARPFEAEEALWAAVEELAGGLKLADRVQTEQALRRWTELLQVMSGEGEKAAESMVHYVAIHLLRELKNMHLLGAEQEEQIWTRMADSRGLKDVLQLVEAMIRDCLAHTSSQKSSELLMHAATDYIDRHLTRDLGMEEVADHLGISCSYFSMLFKQHTGMTFVEYITAGRMELAKSMLCHTDKSIAQVGALSGYADRRYFTKVFHKYVGVTPREWKEHAIPRK
ncbi:response regulator [Xylanibacillus composti]|uniref:response regulator n=1 Tax=Xylanibacillus composti TaxID=1572762 RepID=UPI001BCB954E|nr:response regulator [Xylanibacillus composti]